MFIHQTETTVPFIVYYLRYEANIQAVIGVSLAEPCTKETSQHTGTNSQSPKIRVSQDYIFQEQQPKGDAGGETDLWPIGASLLHFRSFHFLYPCLTVVPSESGPDLASRVGITRLRCRVVSPLGEAQLVLRVPRPDSGFIRTITENK